MAKCSSVHPEDPQRACLRAPTDHADHQDSDGVWPNAEVQQQMLLRRTQKTPKGRKRGRNSTLSAIAAAVATNRRAFNGMSKEEGMAAVETSLASADFRTQFFCLMAEIACERETLSTNDVWDRWEAQQRPAPESRQAAGLAGRALAKMGVLGTHAVGVDVNTSANGHSTDNRVNLWSSLVVGHDPVLVVQQVFTSLVSDGVGSLPESSTESPGIEDTSISPEET